MSVKGLKKRQDALVKAAIAIAKATKNGARPIGHQTAAADALQKLIVSALEFSKVALTGCDGKGTTAGSWLWLAQGNNRIAAAFNQTKKRPYDVVFNNSPLKSR